MWREHRAWFRPTEAGRPFGDPGAEFRVADPVWEVVRERVTVLLAESPQWTGGKQRLTATRHGTDGQQLPSRTDPGLPDGASAHATTSPRESGARAQRNTSLSRRAAWWIGGVLVAVALIIQSVLF